MIRRLLAVAIATLAFAPGALAAGPTVAFVNQSTEVSQAEMESTLPAFQTMVSRDLQRFWGVDATITNDPSTADMTVTLQDGVGCFGCLGYHYIANGKPAAFVDVEASQMYNEAWPLVASHELQEMLVDPYIDRFSRWNKRNWLVEVSDPVEDGLYAYFIDGIPMSDFITRGWYGSVRGQRIDFTRSLHRPGQIGRHGYASYQLGAGWGQVFNFSIGHWDDDDAGH